MQNKLWLEMKEKDGEDYKDNEFSEVKIENIMEMIKFRQILKMMIKIIIFSY